GFQSYAGSTQSAFDQSRMRPPRYLRAERRQSGAKAPLSQRANAPLDGPYSEIACVARMKRQSRDYYPWTVRSNQVNDKASAGMPGSDVAGALNGESLNRARLRSANERPLGRRPEQSTGESGWPRPISAASFGCGGADLPADAPCNWARTAV